MYVIQEINVSWMNAKGDAENLSLSIWQVRRLVKKQREHGDAALEHGNRGRTLLFPLVQNLLRSSLLLLPIGSLIFSYLYLYIV